MAHLSQGAYLDGVELKLILKTIGFKNHKFIEEDGAQCHIFWDEADYIIAFRGTEPDELSDVLADLNALPVRGVSGGWVHKGFQGELDKVWNTIARHREEHKSLKLYITGHSLGGAMATLAASRFNLIDNVECLYTFGSPRVGTRTFKKSCKFDHLRYKNNNDIVTAVPLWLMGYKHHGELQYINFYGNIRKLTTWQKIKDKYRGYRSGILDGAMDHGVENYVEALRKISNV